MKNLANIFGAIIIAIFLFSGCSSDSVESDAKKLAKLACEFVKLEQQYLDGDESILDKLEALDEEGENLSEVFMHKYEDDQEAQDRFNKIFEEEMMKCMEEE
ncbi:MAG: hypothetical protein ACLFNU_01465 [Bacteroidales bacterium]